MRLGLSRIAISGTHCSGKSTLVEAFLLGHPDYLHEPEAYEVLEDQFGEPFSAEPTSYDLFRQLEFHVQRLQQYKKGDCVIFERTIVDYVAYLQALEDLGGSMSDASLTARSLELARENTGRVDAIVFLPLRGFYGEAPSDEDLKLRRRVDYRLQALLLDDELDLFAGDGPTLIEATGTTQQRLAIVDNFLD